MCNYHSLPYKNKEFRLRNSRAAFASHLCDIVLCKSVRIHSGAFFYFIGNYAISYKVKKTRTTVVILVSLSL